MVDLDSQFVALSETGMIPVIGTLAWRISKRNQGKVQIKHLLD